MKVKAAVVKEKSAPFSVEELEIEDPRSEEVLVRLVATGLCHTDLIVQDQDYPVPLPAVLGHEGAGIVEKVGDRVTKVKPGDPVALSFLSCGTCVNCIQGKVAYCLNFYDLNFGGGRLDHSTGLHQNGKEVHSHFFGQSSFATYSLAHERNVVKVPEDVPLELMGPLGCGIQTGAGAVLNSLQVKAGKSIAVFGAGTVGISAVMAAYAAGCTTIISIDLKPERLELARELGATHTIRGDQEDAVKKIQEITGIGAHYALESTGIPKVLRQAVDCIAMTGVCGIIGAPPMGTEVSLDVNTLLFGRTVRGVIEGDSNPDIFIPQLIQLYQQGRFPIDKLMRFYPLEEINQAVEDSKQGKTVKPILQMEKR
ncbi:NAD(P)-dependent alcohol dehydrogenase [Kroppenstedtia pulmonis]|uniref:NAD(P)-dependent alcohol dehydrogenase n=1 Tax=Kroppenstedtia pulmonis TaxID=1380685 RepID=A0A7D4CLG8_9BACL|nr:NAD(P)-dependent alcohol dehydrogenase [Kroppenstedtia pulmonis]QKG83998.1 NAD(P)-dependent alcohol dehydrogenase [Kroppenstedtia pulmonis]